MRLLTIFIFAASLAVSASPAAQTVSLSVKEASLKRVFTEVEKQTGFVVFGNTNLLARSRPVSISVRDMPLASFLDRLLLDQPFAYSFEGKTIILSRAPFPVVSSDQPASSDVYSFIPITGRITDSDGKPIAGVSIMVKGSKTGTTTDANGNFSINAEAGQVLVFSSVEFETKEVKTGGERSLNVVLIRATTVLREYAVLNAGYYSIKEREKTGNITKVSAKTLEKQPVLNVVTALQGRVPGLDIQESGGMPGTQVTVRIRGINSIAGGNDPLYIVDGIPFSAETLGDNQVSRQLANGSFGKLSALNTLNGADIESIEVLKDADATAIYGSRGANGVILITMKKGKAGKTKFDMSISGGVNTPTRFMKMLNTPEYIKLRKDAFAEDGISVIPATAYDINGTWDTTRYTNWYKELTGRPASRLSTQLSMSGGNELTQFLMSGSFLRQLPSFPKGYDFRYHKSSAHFNINHRSENKKFFANFTSNYSTDLNNSPGTDPTASYGTLAPNAPKIYEEDGSLHWETGFDNPLAVLNSTYDAVTKSLNANLIAGYQLGKDLAIKSSFAYNDYALNEYYTNPSTVSNPAFGSGPDASYAFSNTGNRTSWIIEPQLTWKKALGKGILDVLIGATVQQTTSNRKSDNGSNFPSNSLIYDLKSAVIYSLRFSSQALYKYNAVFGRINYSWDGKYIVNFTGRRDGSSRFGPGRQFANFGAVGAAWIFSKEEFMASLPMVSFAKIRGSYGVTGNDQIGDYEFLNTYGTNGRYGSMAGMIPSRHYNPDFSWEENKKLEFAIELGFFQDRLITSASFYQNRSGSQLVGLPISAITGFTSVRANLNAVVENKGLEIEISSKNIASKNFSWNSSFNYSRPRNKLVSYPGLAFSGYANTYVIGEPLAIRKQYHYTGVDPVKGIYTFEDVNKDGLLTSADDRKTVVYEGINYTAAFGNTFSYKSLQLDVFLQYVNKTGQNFIYSIGATGGRSIRNVSRELLDNWTYNKVNPIYQRLTSGGNRDAITANSTLQSSDAMITDASFLRLKNVNLSYEIPKRWIGISGRLFVQGQNLLTLTNYLGSDPESASASYMPPLKVWNFGVQFTF